jgi:hypothetical protein
MANFKALHAEKLQNCHSQKPQEALNLIIYRGVLVSTLLHATVYMFLHNLLNVLVHIANKMGLQKKNLKQHTLYSRVKY